MKNSSFTRRGVMLGLGGLALVLNYKSRAAWGKSTSQEAIVNTFHAALIQVMRDADTLEYADRFNHLLPVIEKSFHLPLMLRIAVGDFWRKASLSQQNRLKRVFTGICVGTYAARFSGYNGQSFLTKGSRKGPRDTILVDTLIHNPSGGDVPLTYVMSEITGTWRIVDVLVSGGISELAVRRSEYRRTLKSEGIEGLIAKLTTRIKSLPFSN